MSIFHIHKFKNANEKWDVGHEISTKNTNPHHDGLESNCISFINSDGGELIRFDDFDKYLAPRYPQDIIDKVNKIRDNAINQLEIELIFEGVRKKLFPELPSRLKCLYATDSLENIDDWVKDVVDNRKIHHSQWMKYEIVELSPLENTKIFKTKDDAIYRCENLNPSEIIRRAQSYWRAECGGKEELLLEGTLKVVKVIYP